MPTMGGACRVGRFTTGRRRSAPGQLWARCTNPPWPEPDTLPRGSRSGGARKWLCRIGGTGCRLNGRHRSQSTASGKHRMKHPVWGVACRRSAGCGGWFERQGPQPAIESILPVMISDGSATTNLTLIADRIASGSAREPAMGHWRFEQGASSGDVRVYADPHRNRKIFRIARWCRNPFLCSSRRPRSWPTPTGFLGTSGYISTNSSPI